MEIRELRRKANLSQSEFHQKLKPAMDRRQVNFPLAALIRAENGQNITDAKMESLLLAIQEVFPEYYRPSINKKKRFLKIPKISILAISGFAITLVVATIIGLYIFNDNKQQTKDIIELLNAIAASLGLIAVVIAIAEYRKRR